MALITLLTRKNLLAEKTRFFISIGGIALSVFLISFLLSLFQGWNKGVGRFVEHVHADVWVSREGTTDFLNAASILPADMQEQLSALPNVVRVDALLVRPMNFDVDGKQVSAHLIGYQVDGGAGGPLKVTKGQKTPGPGEVIVDKAYAKKAGIGIGDAIAVGERQLRVVGISSGGDFVFSQTVFVDIATARDLLTMSGMTTFYLLQLAPGADREAVIAQIEADSPVVGAFTGATFASQTRDRIMSNLIPILFVVVLLAFIVGVAITGLTIYNATVEKAHEYGVLKAIGFTNGYLFRLVLEQSLLTGLIGFVLGVGATFIATRFIGGVVPQFITLMRWQDVVFVLVVTVAMAIGAALMPVRRLVAVDPVSVFTR